MYTNEERYGKNYRGKSAGEIMRSRAPKQTSEELAEQMKNFGEANVKRYDSFGVLLS